MDYNSPDDTVAHPEITRIQSGEFSAQDGFHLAMFLSVTVVVGFIIRFFCRRYCGSYCSRCSHKQDEPEEGTLRISVVDTHRLSLEDIEQPSRSTNQRPIQWVTPQLMVPEPSLNLPSIHITHVPAISAEAVASNDVNSSSKYAINKKKDHGHSKGSILSLSARTMQTVYEEEESDELEDSPSPQPFLRSRDTTPAIVYTFVPYPNQESPEMQRSSPNQSSERTFFRSESVPTNLENRFVDSSSNVRDLPPSYEDLFPSNEALKHSQSNSRQSAADTKIKFDLSKH